MPFKLYNLTPSGKDWARQETGHLAGRGGFRDRLLSRDWAKAQLFAWLPSDLAPEFYTPLEASFAVRLGREYEMDWDYVNAELGYIQAHLFSSPRALFLYQTEYSRARQPDKPLHRAPGEQLLLVDLQTPTPRGYRQEVWVYMDSGFESSEDIRLTAHRGIWPQHGLGILTSLAPDSGRLVTDEVIEPSLVAELSDRAEAILLPGWRGDAFVFVVWPRA